MGFWGAAFERPPSIFHNADPRRVFMRCLSPLSRYSIQVFEAEEQIVVDARGFAQTVVLKKPVIANFDKTGLLDHEIEAVLSKFSFSGLPEGVNPLTRISAFDTDAYCSQFKDSERDEMQVQIEKRLRVLAEQFPNDFIIVDQPAAPKPWPSYDKDSIEDVLKLQQRLEIDPQIIRLYELENADRREIVEAMLRQEDPEGADALYGPESEHEGGILVES